MWDQLRESLIHERLRSNFTGADFKRFTQAVHAVFPKMSLPSQLKLNAVYLESTQLLSRTHDLLIDYLSSVSSSLPWQLAGSLTGGYAPVCLRWLASWSRASLRWVCGAKYVIALTKAETENQLHPSKTETERRLIRILVIVVKNYDLLIVNLLPVSLPPTAPGDSSILFSGWEMFWGGRWNSEKKLKRQILVSALYT